MSNSIPSSSTAASTYQIHNHRRRTTIDDLPEPLTLHILSFLYITEAIQTSLISRKFCNLWHFISSFHFDSAEFYSRSTSSNPRTAISRQRFADVICKTLLFRPPNPLSKFQLKFDYANYDQHKPYLHFWIQKAINLSVSQLILDFNICNFDNWVDDWDNLDENCFSTFDFHLLDLAKSRVEVLKLDSCCLKIPPRTYTVNFPSLKSLELGVLWMEYDDVSNLIKRCVNLEILKMINMEFQSTGVLKICSVTIKELNLELCWFGDDGMSLDFDICCPSLKKIGSSVSEVGKYIIKDITLLEEASLLLSYLGDIEDYDKSWENILGCFSSISSLNVWDKLLESNDIPAGCERFASNLKHLELFCAYNDNDLVGLAALLKLFPRLETLHLRNRGANDANLHQDYMQASTVFNMPCLRKVILINYKKLQCECHFIKLFRKCGIVLENIVLLDDIKSNRKGPHLGITRTVLAGRGISVHFMQPRRGLGT